MMTKIVLPGSYDFGVLPTEQIKIASGGLRGSDLGAFIKRAGTKVADIVRNIKFASGEVPIHLIALGASEYFGANRNFDAFSEECCRKYHDTFVKNARFYRNHLNKNEFKSYGIIKHSCYNEDMHRIELVVALNGTKEAADRNKGLLADKELEKLASGNDNFGVSMACKVAYDVCTVCGNKAKTRDDYCLGVHEGGMCKGAGCRNNLGFVANDGTTTCVDNPYPTWFDISSVYKPADRIAYVFGKLEKAASANRVLGGADLATQAGVTMPVELMLADVSNRKVRDQIKLAATLSAREQEISSNFNYTLIENWKKFASHSDTVTYIPGLDKIPQDQKTHSYVFKALANEKIALSLTDFIQMTGNYSRSRAELIADKVRPHTANTFSRLCSDPEKLASSLSNSPYRPSIVEAPSEWRMWARSRVSEGSLDPKAVEKRAWTKAIREEKPATFTKSATAIDDSLISVANAYGLYKLAFLDEIRNTDKHFELTIDLVLRQNQIS